MKIKKISDGLSVSAQISSDDMAELAKLVFRSIICNRPDGEGADQPTFAEIKKSAHKTGLEAQYIPIISGKVQDSDASAFG